MTFPCAGAECSDPIRASRKTAVRRPRRRKIFQKGRKCPAVQPAGMASKILFGGMNIPHRDRSIYTIQTGTPRIGPLLSVFRSGNIVRGQRAPFLLSVRSGRRPVSRLPLIIVCLAVIHGISQAGCRPGWRLQIPAYPARLLFRRAACRKPSAGDLRPEMAGRFDPVQSSAI